MPRRRAAIRPPHNQPLLWTGPRRVQFWYTPASARASRCRPQSVVRYATGKLMPNREARPCRDHERTWQGRCVDRNLADDWLTALNALRSFRLISICEGHANLQGRPHSAPHINLRLHPAIVRQLPAVWDDFSVGIAAELGRHFSADESVVEAELRLRVQFGVDGARSRPDFVIRVRSRRPRSRPEFEPAEAQWFEGAVLSLSGTGSVCRTAHEPTRGRITSRL